jgi:hypothetical protein
MPIAIHGPNAIFSTANNNSMKSHAIAEKLASRRVSAISDKVNSYKGAEILKWLN